jgi:beta-galactosidase
MEKPVIRISIISFGLLSIAIILALTRTEKWEPNVTVIVPPISAEEWKTQDMKRIKLNFNGNWLFFRGEIKDDAVKDPSFKDKNWQMVHLPHSPKITPLRYPWKPETEGINWYRKHFQLPEIYKGRKIFIEFEGADQVAEVWINGTYLLKHIGAYLPFTMDITDYIQFEEQSNVLAVKINNFADEEIPVYGNWISHGGLYRDVSLHVTDRLHITDAVYANIVAGGGVFVTYPLITDSIAHIQVKTHVLNEHMSATNCQIKTHLVDAYNRVVATVENRQIIDTGKDYTFDQLIRLSDFHLWHPNHPYLYKIHTEIFNNDTLVDDYQTRIGIRRIQFNHEGLTINGERFTFMGTNRVQDYPYVAWAFPNSAQRRDAIYLKEAGFQYVRSSHNPQDPSYLDACDKLGILVMDCIPGFQFIGGAQFREYSFQNMKEIIRRDRNHPSVILWELSLNETEYDSIFAQTAMRIGHEEYPGDQFFVAGWKFPSIYDVFIQASQHGARDYSDKTPLVISEYGHWDFGGGNSTSDVNLKDGELAMLVQARNHQESLNLNRGLSFLCGDGLWVGIDFQCYPSGVMDYFRIPKFSYFFYQSQRDPNLIFKGIDSGPMVFIANYWTEKSPRTITVYSNCELVSLFLNDQFITSQPPDTGIFTENLLHPPFIFKNIPWKAGKLKAIGYIDGKEAASHSRITPGKASFIDLRFNLRDEAMANGEDLFFVYASIVDKNGTIVRDLVKEISFQVTGSGILVSPEKVETEAGTAVVLIRTTDKPGQIVIKAETEGLKEAVTSINCINKITSSL